MRRVTFDQNAATGARQKSKVLRTIKILEDFSTTVLLLKKRAESEMKTPELLAALMAVRSPAIEVKAQFDDEMKFSLRPAVFQKLTRIGNLFTEGKKPEYYYKNKMLEKLRKSSHQG